jgi:hydroxyethylthiazole kinase-like sugar kinase family protein
MNAIEAYLMNTATIKQEIEIIRKAIKLIMRINNQNNKPAILKAMGEEIYTLEDKICKQETFLRSL